MTSPSNCQNLDAYLSNDLSTAERASFDSHLSVCPACLEAVDQQRWIDDLLQSSERIQLERPSAAILDSLRVSVAPRRRRVLQAACGLAAAASLLFAVALLKLNRQAMERLESTENSIAVAQPAHAQTSAEPQATFVSTADAIVVPVDSTSADVTIVQIYPTTDSERRARLEAALSTNL